MYYATTNFKTKADLKKAVDDGAEVGVFAYGQGEIPLNGVVPISGPHAPAKQKWFAQAIIKAGVIVSIK